MKLIRGSSEDKSVVYDAQLVITIVWLETRFTADGRFVIAMDAFGMESVHFQIWCDDPDDIGSELEKLIDIAPPPERSYSVVIQVKGNMRALKYTSRDGVERTRNVFTIKDWKWVDGSTASPKGTPGVAGPPANAN